MIINKTCDHLNEHYEVIQNFAAAQHALFLQQGHRMNVELTSTQPRFPIAEFRTEIGRYKQYVMSDCLSDGTSDNATQHRH